MTEEFEGAVAITVASALPQTHRKKEISLEEIEDTFKQIAENINQIGKLTSKENAVVKNFLFVLKTHMESVKPSIPISTAILPIEYGSPRQVSLQPNGQLQLEYPDGHQRLVDLSEPKNRDFMMTVISEVMPNLETLSREFEEKLLQKNPDAKIKVLKVSDDFPVPLVPVTFPGQSIEIEPVANLPIHTSAPIEVIPKPQLPTVEVPDLRIDRNVRIDAITLQTVNDIKMLGTEVFDQSPVSKYFYDWLMNLHQVILSFESNSAIGTDESFSAEYNQTFRGIEEEISKQKAKEKKIEDSKKTLAENKNLLNNIDEQQTAKIRILLDNRTTAIEGLMRNIALTRKELTQILAAKVSYRHPMQKMAQDQKIAELTQSLNMGKKQLALIVGAYSVNNKKSSVEMSLETQIKKLEAKRKDALNLLITDITELECVIAELRKTKTTNPVKKVIIQQQFFETSQKLFEAKLQLEVAKRNSSDEMDQLRDEYEQIRRTAMKKVSGIEKDLLIRAVDNSEQVRIDAIAALLSAVKAQSEKKKNLLVS
jgi:hypothetical protein